MYKYSTFQFQVVTVFNHFFLFLFLFQEETVKKSPPPRPPPPKIASFNREDSSPDDPAEYFPMTTSMTRELRLDLENLDRQVNKN